MMTCLKASQISHYMNGEEAYNYKAHHRPLKRSVLIAILLNVLQNWAYQASFRIWHSLASA